MIKLFLALGLAAMFSPVFAVQSCDEMKSRIDGQIKGHGVTSYSLDIIPNADVKEQKVVGSCDGGTKKLVYKKG